MKNNNTVAKKNTIIFIIALLIMAALYLLPVPQEWGLSKDGKTSLVILSLLIILWMTEAIPFPVTGLLLIILIPIFGLASFKNTVSVGFGNPIIVFFISVMIMSAALSESGFTNRLTILILNKIGTKTSTLILIFLIIGAFLSMWITNMAVAAILFPIALKILENSDRKPLKSNFGKALMISIAWGCGIGGMGSPVGNGSNVLAVGFLYEMAQIDITFIEWMKVGVPSILISLPISWLLLLKIFPMEIEQLSINNDFLKQELIKLGKLTKKEKVTLFVFIITITMWLISPIIESNIGTRIPIQGVAVFSAITLFLPYFGVLSWRQVEKTVNWGAIVLIAGGISMGQSLFDTGSAYWLARTFLLSLGNLNVLLRIILIVLLVLIMKIFIASNTAAGLVIIPIMIALAQESGLDVWLIVGPAALAISLAFITIPSSPTNVIPYSAGFFSIKDFAFAGVFMSLIGAFAITISFILFHTA